MVEYIGNGNISGLDMKPTIQWYEANKQLLLPKLPQILDEPVPYEVENPENIQLSNGDISALLNLSPKNARERSILRKIIGQPKTWFHRESTQQQPLPTTTIEDALSPTAIIPAYTDVSYWQKTGDPKCDVWLYKISEIACSPEVRKIILSESLIHEVFGHTLINPALYDEHTLKLPKGREVNSFDYMFEFAKMAENHPPISHYASVYRGKNNKFESDDKDYNPNTPISEELSETIAAFLLGFAFSNDEQRSMNPFADRPEIKKFVEDFLNAELVSKSQ